MAIKFIRTADHDVSSDGWTVIQKVPNKVGVETLVGTFKLFLLGLGYSKSEVDKVKFDDGAITKEPRERPVRAY